MNKYYSEIIYGGVDGLITTFAIIAGSLGGSLSNRIVLILGLASIIADGFSMGLSSYLAEKARVDGKKALKVGLVTFLSFLFIGIFPLIPFFFKFNDPFRLSSYILIVLLFLLGYAKDYSISGGIETLIVGGFAAGIAYYVAKVIAKYEDDENN
jgi:VIT1/CCC1 family predicted Fe2+/Mn2+ transporter